MEASFLRGMTVPGVSLRHSMNLTCGQGGDRVPWDGAAVPLAASYLGPSLAVVTAALWGNGKCGVLGAPGKMLQEKVGGGGLRLVPSHRGLGIP